MSPFILATAILDFWRMSSRRHTIGLLELAPLKILTVKTWALGIAVGILLLALCHCALEVEISLQSKCFYSSVAGKRRKKLLPGQGVYNMPIFILSALCSQTVFMLSGHILPKNASIFTCIHRGLTSFPCRETLEPL